TAEPLFGHNRASLTRKGKKFPELGRAGGTPPIRRSAGRCRRHGRGAQVDAVRKGRARQNCQVTETATGDEYSGRTESGSPARSPWREFLRTETGSAAVLLAGV